MQRATVSQRNIVKGIALQRDCVAEGLRCGGIALWRDCVTEGLRCGGIALNVENRQLFNYNQMTNIACLQSIAAAFLPKTKASVKGLRRDAETVFQRNGVLCCIDLL